MAQVGTMRSAGVKIAKQDTHIEREDQDKINKFSRINMKYTEAKEDLKQIKADIDNLDDATQQVEEALGEELMIFLGECFVLSDEEGATNYCEKLMEEKQNELEKKQDEIEEMESQMKVLKTFLYAKFGGSINLEENA